jgi:hypothetical protein
MIRLACAPMTRAETLALQEAAFTSEGAPVPGKAGLAPPTTRIHHGPGKPAPATAPATAPKP